MTEDELNKIIREGEAITESIIVELNALIKEHEFHIRSFGVSSEEILTRIALVMAIMQLENKLSTKEDMSPKQDKNSA